MQHAHTGADTGLSAPSYNVPYGFELVALRGVQFDTVVRDDDISSWGSVIYRKFMGTYVQYLVDKGCARKDGTPRSFA